MSLTGLVNQLKDNSTKTSVSTLKEISTLSLDYHKEDILISLEETLSSRHRTEEAHKNGTSIKYQELLDQEPTTNPLTS
jgi:hypothetical protein